MSITVYFSKRNKDGRSLSLGDRSPKCYDEASNKEQVSTQPADFVLHQGGSKSYEGDKNNTFLESINPVEQYKAKQSLYTLKRELEAQLILNLVRRNYLQNQFQDPIAQNNSVKPQKLKNQQMLDLVLALELVHHKMGVEELYSMPSPSHPMLVYRMLEWLSELPTPITKQKQIISLQTLQELFESNRYQTKTILEELLKEFYFITFLQHHCSNYNNENSTMQARLVQTSSFNQYLGEIVDQIENSRSAKEVDLVLKDFKLMITLLSEKMDPQSMIKQLRDQAGKNKLNKLTIGFNMLVAQLRFKVINNKGDEIIIIVPFQTDQKTIRVEQLDEGVASSNDKINKKCYGHKIFNEEVNRHSEQNLIVALSLECDKVREIKQFENSIQQTSQFFQLLKTEFQQAGYLPFIRIEKITLQIASSEQVCPTCKIFLNNPHSEIADDIQEFCINQQLVLTKNPKPILYKYTLCIYTEDVIKGQAMKPQQQAEKYVKIDPKPNGLFSIDMIQARYFQSQCSPNLNYLKVPFKKMKLKHTIIFSGPKSYPKKYEQEDDAQLVNQNDTKSQQNQVKRKKPNTKAIYNSSKSGKIKERRSQFDDEQNEDHQINFVVECTQSEALPQAREEEEQEIKSKDDSSVQSKVISKIIDLIEHMKVFEGQ